MRPGNQAMRLARIQLEQAQKGEFPIRYEYTFAGVEKVKRKAKTSEAGVAGKKRKRTAVESEEEEEELDDDELEELMNMEMDEESDH